jgi:hypothetical protein
MTGFPFPWMLVFWPWIAAALLAAMPPGGRLAPLANLGAAAITFVLALACLWQPEGLSGWTRLDALNLPLVLTAALIGLFRAKGWPVIHTRESHLPDLSDCLCWNADHKPRESTKLRQLELERVRPAHVRLLHEFRVAQVEFLRLALVAEELNVPS